MKSALTDYSLHFHPLLPGVVLLPITPSGIFWMCLSKGDFAFNPSRIDSPSLIVSSLWLVFLWHFGNSPKPSRPLGIHLRVHTSGICVWAENPSNHFIEATCICSERAIWVFCLRWSFFSSSLSLSPCRWLLPTRWKSSLSQLHFTH